MPTTKSARARMNEAVSAAAAEGNVALANEITANVMVGTVLMLMFVAMVFALVLNEVGVFTADKHIMRIAVLIGAIVEVPITVLNSKYVGMKPWLRIPLMVDLTIVCALLAATLGHNVMLSMVIPVIVSTRYFDVKYTTKVSVFTFITFAIAAVCNGFFGIMNLNMVSFPADTVINAAKGETVRSAISSVDIDKAAYIKSLLINDFAPRLVAFILIAVICCYVSSRGKRMIDMQSENATKTARIETELDLATKIQTSMLPCILPAFPTHENIDLRAVYHPAKEVGGDFYDYFIIDKTHVGIVIADVSGKGVGAALFMTISKTVLKNQLQLGIPPVEAINNANRQLCENNDAGLFVTCWAGVYDTENGIITFVNAGHNPPVVMRKGETPKFLSQRAGFVLAGMENFRYREEQIQLSSGDEMFFYTDGVTEATNTSEQLYGSDRLLDTLENCQNLPVSEQLTYLKNDIDDFVGGADQFDDITIMAMKIN